MGRYSHDIHSESFWYIWYIWYLLYEHVSDWISRIFFMMWLWKSYWDCGGPPEAQQGLARSLGRLGGRLDINWHRLDVQLDIQLSPLGTKVLVIESLIRHWCQIWPRFLIRFNKRTVLLWHNWWLPVDFDGCEAFFIRKQLPVLESIFPLHGIHGSTARLDMSPSGVSRVLLIPQGLFHSFCDRYAMIQGCLPLARFVHAHRSGIASC